MKKVTYIISDIDKALAFEWIATYLDKEKYMLEFVLLNKGESHLESFLITKNFNVKRTKLFTGWKMIFSFFPLWFYLLKSKPNIIHTHLRYASLLGITAGYFAGIKNRIHTRHNSSFHNIYHPHAVITDKWVSRLSTKIVSISDVVTDVLVNWENTPKEKVVKIPHGFDLSIFQNIDQFRIKNLKDKYAIPNTNLIIGMISRYITWKGCLYGIEAFRLIRSQHPNAHLILANANGPDSAIVKKKLQELPNDSYTEIVFEADVAALYQLFQVFIHVPIDNHFEAFGQTYIEALASGIPSVFTQSGIACEMIEHAQNALVVPYKNSEAIFEAMNRIIEDKKLSELLVKNGIDSVQAYNLPTFIARLEALYA